MSFCMIHMCKEQIYVIGYLIWILFTGTSLWHLSWGISCTTFCSVSSKTSKICSAIKFFFGNSLFWICNALFFLVSISNFFLDGHVMAQQRNIKIKEVAGYIFKLMITTRTQLQGCLFKR